MRAGLLAREGSVDVGGCFPTHNDERDSDYELWRCRGAAGAAELQAQIAVGAFVDLAAGSMEVRPIHRYREQQRRYRQEGDELA